MLYIVGNCNKLLSFEAINPKNKVTLLPGCLVLTLVLKRSKGDSTFERHREGMMIWFYLICYDM